MFFSIALVVIDSDGSAFITKAEFDSLKNNFQSQIDEFNMGIDGKIDTAIASYLSGIKIGNEPLDLFSQWKAAVGSNPRWIKLIDAGSTTIPGTSIIGALSETVNAASNLFWDTFSGTSKMFYSMLVALPSTDIIHNWGIESPNILRTDTANKRFEDVSWGTNRTDRDWNTTTYPIKYSNFNYKQQFSEQTDGSGKKWLYQSEGSRKYIKYFCPVYYANSKIEYYGHYYKKFDFGTTQDNTPAAYFSDNGKAFTTALPTIDVVGAKGSIKTAGTRGSDTDVSDWRYLSLNSSIVKITDGNNYLNTFFSITSDSKIYALDEEYQGEDGNVSIKKETYTIPDQSFSNIYYSQSGGRLQTNSVKGTKFSYAPITIKDDSIQVSLNSFCNEGASNLISEDVYHGGGMPIVQIIDSNVKMKVSLKLKSATDVNCKVTLSREQFINGSTPSSKQIDQQVLLTNNIAPYDFIFTPSECKYVWIFIENTTNNDDIEIEDIKIATI